MSRSTMRVPGSEGHPGRERRVPGAASHRHHELASRYMWLVDAEFDEQYGDR
jgi:hypothetical protein